MILYIDDLDRCHPKRVVEVLAAVHLLLALPLFVVVVAVDPRWLRLSLRHHYAELLADVDEAATSASLEGAPTPLDYLDKIFQVPYALRPMGDSAGAYLQALLPTEASIVEPPTPPPQLSTDAGTAQRPVPTARSKSPRTSTPDRPWDEGYMDVASTRRDDEQLKGAMPPLGSQRVRSCVISNPRGCACVPVSAPSSLS